MIELVFYAVALMTAAWAVWVRRKCWTIPWERTTTSAIAQLMLALVLLAPATEPYTGRLFCLLTGRWHMDNLLGFMLELGALVSSNIAAMMRMPTMRRYIVPMLWHPLVIATAVQMMLFWHSSITHDPGHDILQLPHHGWLTTFFVLQCALVGYYGGINAWCARVHLRGDSRSRPVALAWLVCVGLGGGSMLGFLLPALGLVDWFDYCRLAMCACVAVFAVSSARSWQRKLDQWRGLIQVTGARL
ncbi:MAG: hypothetical protein ACLPLP_22625 [Mycobacterium sp.]